MLPRTLKILCAVTALLAAAQVQAATVTFDTRFSASQSLWGGGPSAGFDVGDSFEEWQVPGSSPLSLTLIDESFALDFNTLQATDLFSIEVAAVPLPAAFWLFGSALVGFIGISRRRKLN